jgi:hypothetical protein
VARLARLPLLCVPATTVNAPGANVSTTGAASGTALTSLEGWDSFSERSTAVTRYRYVTPAVSPLSVYALPGGAATWTPSR